MSKPINIDVIQSGAYRLNPNVYPKVRITPECTFINDKAIHPQELSVVLPNGMEVQIESLVQIYITHLKRLEK